MLDLDTAHFTVSSDEKSPELTWQKVLCQLEGGESENTPDSLDSEEIFLMLWTVESYFWCFGQWKAISDIVDGEVPFLILWTVEIVPPTILQSSVQISTETLELIIISIPLIKIRCHYFLSGEHRAYLRP